MKRRKRNVAAQIVNRRRSSIHFLLLAIAFSSLMPTVGRKCWDRYRRLTDEGSKRLFILSFIWNRRSIIHFLSFRIDRQRFQTKKNSMKRREPSSLTAAYDQELRAAVSRQEVLSSNFLINRFLIIQSPWFVDGKRRDKEDAINQVLLG